MDKVLLSLVEKRPVEGPIRSFEAWCGQNGREGLLAALDSLEEYRRSASNFYHRVRSIFFLYAIHRFHLPPLLGDTEAGHIPFDGFDHALARRYEEAISIFLRYQATDGPSDALSSALAMAYHSLAFKTLATQVQKSVRAVSGNRWMFRMGHALDHPLRLRHEMLERPTGSDPWPVLFEETPVRMDLSHSAWSDIFFLGMDYPECARVLNVSIDLGVHGRDATVRPPVSAYLRVIDEPVLRLISLDLEASAEISTLAEVFDYAKDYLGLLKAAVIASGLVPAGLEGSGQSLEAVLGRVCGPGRGLELISHVRNIPKGSRLAVSTNLLACLIALCMRATGQTRSLTGPLEEDERRTVAGRAILGEWLGGSGGGWQDSGGVWPGIKLIEGELAREGDVESGISRGRLLPRHTIMDTDRVSKETRQQLQDSLILVHGGLSQNVGPILEMVTEKYLLQLEQETEARAEAGVILDQIVATLESGDLSSLGSLTTRNFMGPLQTIIPWASTAFTERLIDDARQELGGAYRGFWMLGGMSGGGMGFMVDPDAKAEMQERLLRIMRAAKADYDHALPFAMEPVVYDFAINEKGSSATLCTGADATIGPEYYLMMVPRWIRQDPRLMTRTQRIDIECFRRDHLSRDSSLALLLVERVVPNIESGRSRGGSPLPSLLEAYGFDSVQHERIRTDLQNGRIGLSRNRLSTSTQIDDVRRGDVEDLVNESSADDMLRGEEALREGRVAVVTLAAGAGSRWTQGAGTVKALHPFARLGSRHRSFVEVHLAKTRGVGHRFDRLPTHIVTTSYLTHDPIKEFLDRNDRFGFGDSIVLSPGRSIGLRLVPMVRDLRFAWEELAQQQLDPQQEKVRQSLRKALMDWAEQSGQATDYTDNLPLQCLHPVGHWYEVANLLLNGTLRDLVAANPGLSTLLLHNIDTLGADLDPAVLGRHLNRNSPLSVEVIARRIEDRGGGLARVNGQLRLLEGLAMPREEDEFNLSYYNTLTSWIEIDGILERFGLARSDLSDSEKVQAGVRQLAERMPTYVTIKEVKKRWGHGQEDIFPVAQFEKLWGDMTVLPDFDCHFFVVPRSRGQQLKDQAQLDGWLRDGSAALIESLCKWE
ncbi:MAG: UTP--glucose-1-phosphate uridylyltransferase [Verrucomicrobia bacterium]|nr:MAG: UTP--glucose-1-phosphate uridylyltransferase [Verrucomicrobiota bacterium]